MKALRLTLLCRPLTAAQRAGRFAETDPPSLAPPPCAPGDCTYVLFAEPALADRDMGRWAGLSLKHIQATEPLALEAWRRDSDYQGHGGESFDELCRRVGAWLRSVEGQQGHWLVPSHPWVIRAALAWVLGLNYLTSQAIDAHPGGRMVLAYSDRWRLVVA